MTSAGLDTSAPTAIDDRLSDAFGPFPVGGIVHGHTHTPAAPKAVAILASMSLEAPVTAATLFDTLLTIAIVLAPILVPRTTIHRCEVRLAPMKNLDVGSLRERAF